MEAERQPCVMGICAICPWWTDAKTAFEELMEAKGHHATAGALERFQGATRVARQTCPKNAPSRRVR